MVNRRLPQLAALLLVALQLLSGAALFSAAWAQVPPPVPALPDSERRIQYSISASTCTCGVGFALFGNGIDVDSWIEVWISGTRYLSTDLTHGWSLSSATGTLATIPRPVTNAVLTFNAVQTGVVQIVGAERPRRLSQFQENRGVAARDLNQVITDLTAQNRETWDRTNDITGRTLRTPPGETLATMPSAASRQGNFLCFDGATGLVPQVCAPLSAPITGGANIWVGDQLFKSGRPWYDVRAYGAVGDGTTDDSTALNAAATAASITGGIFFVPNGNYCWKSGGSFTGTVPVQIMGEGLNTELQTCGADVNLLTLNNAKHYLHDIVLAGPNILATTHDTIVLQSACTECRIDHVIAVQGRYVLNNAASDVALSYLTLTQSYGGAIIYNGAAAGTPQFWGNRLKVDQLWPVSIPTRQAAFPARANTTGYSTGNVVSSQGFYLQATNNGTSGGSPPTLLPYNTNITDGTVTWKLVAPTTFSSIQLDTGSGVVSLQFTDMSGPFTYGLLLSNTLAGTGPQNTVVTDSFFAGILGGIHAAAGAGLDVKGGQFLNCITNGCTGILLDTSWFGDTSISNAMFINNPLGISVANPNSLNNTAIANNKVYGSTTAAVALVCASLSNVTLIGNHLGSSNTWGTNAIGLLFNTGAGNCDNVYGIPTNDFAGATTAISFGGVLGNHTDGYPVFGYAIAKAVNFNSANTDNAIQIPIAPGAVGYLVNGIRIVNASQTLTTATFGLFTAVAAGGTIIQAAGTAITVSTAASGTNNNSQLVTPANSQTQSFAPASSTPAATLQFRVGTAQGAAAIGDVQIEVRYIY